MSERTIDERWRAARTIDERSVRGTTNERHSEVTIDERGTTTTRLRTVLPDALLERFEPLANLGFGGGQADLVLCRELATDRSVVVKLYRHSAQLSREVLNKLHQAKRQHVVELLAHGDSDGELWEVQEYCAEGTLADLLTKRGGRVSGPELVAVVKELAEAIQHVHEDLGITHRDLKPENVLVRSSDPLDLVLTDFGIAAEQMMTVQFQTRAGSSSWMAPEALSEQQVTNASDWWALGAIVYRALVGRLLLSLPDGELQPDKVHSALVVRGEYTTEAVEDERWRLLIDGLLSFETADRWRYAQVADWLAGRNPKAVRTTPRGAGATPSEPDFAFVLGGRPAHTGKELADAVRERWDAAGDLMAGRINPELERWLKARSGGQQVLDSVSMERSPGGRLIRLQAALDPGGPLEFRRREVNGQTLSSAIAEAANWHAGATGPASDSHTWLGALQKEQILRAMAAVVPGEAGRAYGSADSRLNTWADQFRRVREAVPQEVQADLDQVEAQLRANLFAYAFGTASYSARAARAREVISVGDVGLKPWAVQARELASGTSDDAIGTLLAAEAVVEFAVAATRSEAERVAAERAARERQATEEAARAARERLEQQAAQQAAERRERRQANTKATPARFGARVLPAVIYSLVCALLLARGEWSLVLSFGWPVLLICLIPIAMSLVVDWVLDDPSGGLRGVGATLGVALGLGPWVTTVETMVATNAEVLTPVDMVLLPWGLGVGWMVGAGAQRALGRVAHGRPGWGSYPGRALRRSRAIVLTALWLATLSAATSGFFASCGDGCSAGAARMWAWAWPFNEWQMDPLGMAVGSGILWVTAFAWGSYEVAKALWIAKRAVSVASLIVSCLVAVVVFLAYPVNPLTRMLSMVVGWFI